MLTVRRRWLVGSALAIAAGPGAGAVAVQAVAATERVTLAIRPDVIGVGTEAVAFGRVSNGRAGEDVVFEIRDCGQTRYREFAGATTAEGGSYGTPIGYRILISGSVRARWRSAVSEEVEVKRRAVPSLRRLFGGRLRVLLVGARSFHGRRVRIERWDRRARRWVGTRHVTLESEGGELYPGVPSASSVLSGREFRVRVPRGTALRAVFADAQAGPCYLGGVSRIVRT